MARSNFINFMGHSKPCIFSIVIVIYYWYFQQLYLQTRLHHNELVSAALFWVLASEVVLVEAAGNFWLHLINLDRHHHF